ncbi:MAG: MmcQ/YjbR family DNA-binding protein [Ahrensia sp.]|nr:MmcQ/YjbR family DNA-binding protein [Ahrensia sp.]
MVDAADLEQHLLSFPETMKSGHMGTIDFRAPRKIFATLPDPETLRLNLKPEQQALYLETQSEVFAPVKGAWGGKGWTEISLADCLLDDLKPAISEAWHNVALKRMVAALNQRDAV